MPSEHRRSTREREGRTKRESAPCEEEEEDFDGGGGDGAKAGEKHLICFRKE